jgi:hypothetical protein
MQGEQPAALSIDVEESFIGLVRKGAFVYEDGARFEGDYITVPVPTLVKFDSPWTQALQANAKKPPPPKDPKNVPVEEPFVAQPTTTVLRHGKGKYSCQALKCSFEGDWVLDNPHGSGMLIYEDGTMYKGAWKDNVMHGQGEYTWSDRSKCTAEFVNGLPNGNVKYMDRPDDIVSWAGPIDNGTSARGMTYSLNL